MKYENQARTQLVGISYMRVSAMLLVVLYHCLCMFTYRWNFSDIPKYTGVEIFCEVLNYIHLPTFMCISGFLYGIGIKKGKYSNLKTFIKKKCMRLGVPYLFWGGIMLMLQPNFYNWQLYVRGFAHLWFLLCLLEIFVFVALGKKWIVPDRNRNKFVVFILSYTISCALHEMAPHTSVLTYFCLDKFIYYFPIFYLGIILSQNIKWLNANMLWGIFGVLISIVLLWFFSICPIAITVPLSFLMLNRLAGYIIVVCCFLLFCNITANSLSCKLLDRNSMGIYILHHIIIFYLLQYSLFKHFMESNILIGVVCLFFGVLAMSLLVSELILRTKLKIIMG